MPARLAAVLLAFCVPLSAAQPGWAAAVEALIHAPPSAAVRARLRSLRRSELQDGRWARGLEPWSRRLPWLVLSAYPAVVRTLAIPFETFEAGPQQEPLLRARLELEELADSFLGSIGELGEAGPEEGAELERDLGFIESFGPALEPSVVRRAAAARRELAAALAQEREGRRGAIREAIRGVAALWLAPPEEAVAPAARAGVRAPEAGGALEPVREGTGSPAGAVSIPSPGGLSSSLGSSAFRWLLATQFLSVFNDNLLKSLNSFMLLGMTVRWSFLGAEAVLPPETLIGLAGAAFILPFVPLSGLGGAMADRIGKHRIMVGLRLAEVGITALNTAALYSASPSLACLSLFLMGAHSAIHGPAKSGMLKELLPMGLLSDANGKLEGASYVGFVAGMGLGGLLTALFPGGLHLAGLATVVLALLGTFASLKLPSLEPAGGAQAYSWSLAWRPFADLWAARGRDRALFSSYLGIGFLWLLCSMVIADLFGYGRQLLRLDETGTGLLQSLVALGSGAGAVLAGTLWPGRAERRLLPWAALGMAGFSIWLALSYTSVAATMIGLVALGGASGFFLVPLVTSIQERSGMNETGRFVGAGNVLMGASVALGMAAFAAARNVIGLDPAQLFWLLALASLAAARLTARHG